MDTPPCTSELILLSRPEIELIIIFGEHPHEIKGNNSRRDLYKDRRGEIFIWQKFGPSEPEPTGLNLRRIKEHLRHHRRRAFGTLEWERPT